MLAALRRRAAEDGVALKEMAERAVFVTVHLAFASAAGAHPAHAGSVKALGGTSG